LIPQLRGVASADDALWLAVTHHNQPNYGYTYDDLGRVQCAYMEDLKVAQTILRNPKSAAA